MKKYCFLLISVMFSAISSAQSVKSISIHDGKITTGWLYGINEIDSITIDDKGLYQNLNIEGIIVSHKMADIDYVDFSTEDAPTFYCCVKLLNDTAFYIIRNSGYVRLYGDAYGCITMLDAFINNIPLIINLDSEQRVKSIRTDSLDLYFDYQNDKTIIYGQFFSSMIYDILENYMTDNSKEILLTQSKSTNYWQELIKSAGEKIKNFSVEKGLNKVLNIEFNGNDSYVEAVRKSHLRSSIKDLMDMAGIMLDIQKFEDMRAEDILKEVEEMPDLGGIENAMYFGQYIDPTGSVARFNKWILPPLKKIQDHNKTIVEQREKEANRPTLIFGIQTGTARNITKNSAECAIDGVIKAEANKGEFNFDYGICYSTSPQPTISQNVKSTVTSNGFLSSINIALPQPFVLSSLKPNTTYYYRAFLKDNITGNIIYADNIKKFTTFVDQPVAITGNCLDVTKTTALISCTYKNVPENGICGVEYTWNEGSVRENIGSLNGAQEISLNGLKPGTVYNYCAYIEVNDQTYYGEDKTFTTEVEYPDLSGTWTCTEYKDNGDILETSTLILKSDKTATTTSSAMPSDIVGNWSVSADGKASIFFDRSTNVALIMYQIRGEVNNISSPTRIEGTSMRGRVAHTTSREWVNYYRVVLTR